MQISIPINETRVFISKEKYENIIRSFNTLLGINFGKLSPSVLNKPKDITLFDLSFVKNNQLII